MGLGAWWNKLRRQEDEERIERKQEESSESPAERAEESEDRLGRAADARAAGLAGETIRTPTASATPSSSAPVQGRLVELLR
jgi:hypothetical protein